MSPARSLTPRESASVFAARVLGVVPHAGQAEYLESKARTRVVAAGRRFGKTTMAACDHLHFASTVAGSTGIFVAPTMDQAHILWDMARVVVERTCLAEAVTQVVESPFPELRMLARDMNGQERESVIMARSAGHDAKYVRGRGADKITVDEAAYVPDRVLTDVLPPMLATSSHRQLTLVSTPWGTGNAFHRLYVAGQSRLDLDVQSFHFPSAANPMLDPAYLEGQRNQMTEVAYAVEYEARFIDRSDSVFSWPLIQGAVDPHISATPYADHRYVIGYDPAKYGDRSGVAVLDVSTTPMRLVAVRDIASQTYLTQAETMRHLAEKYNDAQVVMDCTAHAQMLETLLASNIDVEGVTFTSAVKAQLVDGLLMALERGQIRILEQTDLIDELRWYSYEQSPSGVMRYGAPDHAHDDLTTALMLAVHGATSCRDEFEDEAELEMLLSRDHRGQRGFAVTEMRPFGSPIQSTRSQRTAEANQQSFRNLLRSAGEDDPWDQDPYGVGY